MKVSYYSLGCKVNLYEAEAVIGEFLDNGFTLGNFNEICDIYIINTCTVTRQSDAKSRKIIRQAIRRNPEAVICVMGCYAQLSVGDIKKIDGVDIIVGTNNRSLLYPLALEALEKRNKRIIHSNILEEKDYEDLKLTRYNNKTRGFIKISDGCSNFCSYCAIPFARGPVRSRRSEEIISEITTLTNQGVKEIVLTGINTAAYGVDLNDYNFSNLLTDIIKEVPNLGRIRISSIEVTETTDQLLTIIKENSAKFANHFHIPLQSGSDKILQLMSRKYNLDYYRKRINKIRTLFPDVNITSDVMIGFSGETEEDFLDIKDFLTEISFGEMHVFPYSPRPNTRAYKYKNRVSPPTQRFRVNELLQLNEINALKYREKFIGKTLEVVVESINAGVATGYTSNYIQIEFPVKKARENDLVQVKLTKANYPKSQGIEVENL